MKKLKIAKQVNLLDEAYMLLCQWVNDGDIEKTREKYADNALSDPESFNRKFGIVSEMYHYVVDNIKAEKERIEYYFKERNPQFSTFASLAIFFDFRSDSDEIPSFKERMEALGDNKIREFASNINGEEATSTPVDELSTVSDLISFIEASSYEPYSKWEAVKIFNNQEFYYNEVSQILKEVITLLKEKYISQIEELSGDFFKYWSDYQEAFDIIETINEKLKISWRISKKGCCLYPAVFMPFSVSIAFDSIPDGSRDIVRFGIMLDKNLDTRGHKIKKEDLIEIGKLLSDKSKVDILEIISKKSCYGKEIANELNLSTATISYHVNALLRIGFIQAEIISNKVYYRMNREKITSFMEDVKEFFDKL